MSIMLGSRASRYHYPDGGTEVLESQLAYVSSITPLECVVPLHVNNGKLRKLDG